MKKAATVFILCVVLVGRLFSETVTAYWMGNSYSMDLPSKLENMWPETSPAFDLNVTEQFYGGTSLEEHWKEHHAHDSIGQVESNAGILRGSVFGLNGKLFPQSQYQSGVFISSKTR